MSNTQSTPRPLVQSRTAWLTSVLLDRLGRAQVARPVQFRSRPFDRQHARASKLCELHHEGPDTADADHQRGLAQRQPGAANGVIGRKPRVAVDGGVMPGDAIGDRNQLVRGHQEPLGITAVAILDAQDARHVRAKLLALGLVPWAFGRDEEVIGNDTVAGRERAYALANGFDHARRLMPHDERQIRRIPEAVEQFEVGPIDPACSHPDHHVIGAGAGIIDLFDRKRGAERSQHRRLHGVPVSCARRLDIEADLPQRMARSA